MFRSFDISPEPHPVWTNNESYAKSKFGHALRLAPPTPSHPEIRSLEGIPVSAAAAAYVSVLPTTQAAPQAANRPLRTTGSRAPLPAARRAPPALPAPRAPHRSPRTAAPARPRRACALTQAPPPFPPAQSTASAQARFCRGGAGLRRSWGAARAQKAPRRVYVAGACRRNGRPPPPRGAGRVREAEGEEFRNRRRRSAPLGDRSPVRWGKKKPPQSYVRKRRLCTRGDPSGAGGPRNGRETRPLLTRSAAGRAPPLPAPLGAAVHGSPARAAATAVIPSILNLTSSHTRDEVIEGNARHVRSAPIGRQQSGGRGAGAAGRAAAGDGDGGSPTRRPSPLFSRSIRGRAPLSAAAVVLRRRQSPRWREPPPSQRLLNGRPRARGKLRQRLWGGAWGCSAALPHTRTQTRLACSALFAERQGRALGSGSVQPC